MDSDIPVLHVEPATAIGAAVPWFRQKLATLGHAINRSSALASELELLEKYRAASLRQDVVKYRDAAELVDHQLRVRGTDFITKALHRAETSGWSGWHDRAGHLSSGVPNLVAPSPRSSARDLSWETVVAAVCVNFCENVSFGEPDVLATFKGKSLGLAAKVLYSANPSKQLNRVVEGAKQGERSGVDETYVICNITSLIPHANLFRQMDRARVRSPRAAKEVIDGWLGAFQTQHDEAQWLARLKERKTVRAVVLFAPVMVPSDELPTGFIYTAIAAAREDRDPDFEVTFHTACQSVLRHVPENHVGA